MSDIIGMVKRVFRPSPAKSVPPEAAKTAQAEAALIVKTEEFLRRFVEAFDRSAFAGDPEIRDMLLTGVTKSARDIVERHHEA